MRLSRSTYVGAMSADTVGPYGTDIYTEPDADPDTLANLGPLRGLAGIWESAAGGDDHPVGPGSDIDGPVVDGGLHNVFVERYELQPIDPQTNGPQLFYGLRYHIHIVKPGEVETFHDQVGYWLWEPAAQHGDPHDRDPTRAGRPRRRRGRTRRHGVRGHRVAGLRDATASCRIRSSTPRSGRSASGSASPCTTTARGPTRKTP